MVFAGTIVVGGLFEGVIVNVSSEQISAVWVGITGSGLTTTVNVNAAPSHIPWSPEVGVTVYTSV